jgi:hypothetical protein
VALQAHIDQVAAYARDIKNYVITQYYVGFIEAF